jgi:hypothetical protein
MNINEVEKAIYLLSIKDVTSYKVSKATGISESTIGRYLKGDKPTLANAKMIIRYFESKNEKTHNDAKAITNFNYAMIPLVTIHAQGGYAKGYGDEEYIEQLPTVPVMVDKTYKGKYIVFEVDGDSMDDGSRNSIYDGDKILCREVKRELWKSKLHIKDWYFVIVLKNEGITVKKIVNHSVENGLIKCHPLNSLFEDFTVSLNDVSELYSVVKIVDRNIRL